MKTPGVTKNIKNKVLIYKWIWRWSFVSFDYDFYCIRPTSEGQKATFFCSIKYLRCVCFTHTFYRILLRLLSSTLIFFLISDMNVVSSYQGDATLNVTSMKKKQEDSSSLWDFKQRFLQYSVTFSCLQKVSGKQFFTIFLFREAFASFHGAKLIVESFKYASICSEFGILFNSCEHNEKHFRKIFLT